MSTVRVHSVSVAPGGSSVRVHTVGVSGVSLAASTVRVHAVGVAGSLPAGALSRVRVHSASIAGVKTFQQFGPSNVSHYDTASKTWKPLSRDKLSRWDKPSQSWQAVWGGTPVPQPPIDPTSPIVDAGSVAVGAATYTPPAVATYMATTGSDTTGNGTQAKPYATLSKAYAATPAGGTVVIRGGVYNDGGDTQTGAATLGALLSGNAVTIQNYPSEAVWFDGSRPATSWTSAGTTWSTPYDRLLDRSPTDQRGVADDPRPGWSWTNPAYPRSGWPDQVFYDGVQLTQVGALSDVGPGKFFVNGAATGSGFWFRATSLVIGDDPTGHEVRVTDKVKFLTLLAPGSTVRGIGVRRYSPSIPDAGMIQSSRAGTTWENVWLEDSSANAMSFSGATTVSGGNQTARKVTIRRAGALGFHAYMADGLLLDRVDVQYVNNAHLNYAPQTGGIKITRTQGVTVQNSVFKHNYAKAFWADQTVDTITIVNNLMEDQEQIGLVLELSSKAIVANNKIIGADRAGIFVANTDRVRLWNNTVVDCAGTAITTASRPVTFYQDSRNPNDSVNGFNRDQRQPQSYYDLPENQWQINNLEMFNMVIARPRKPQAIFAVEDLNSSKGTARPLAAYHPLVDGNLYHWASQPTYPWIMPPPSPSANATVYFNLPALRTGAGLDLNSTSVTADPLNADLTVKDATLHSKAAPLPADIADLIGQPAGSRRVGCYW